MAVPYEQAQVDMETCPNSNEEMTRLTEEQHGSNVPTRRHLMLAAGSLALVACAVIFVLPVGLKANAHANDTARNLLDGPEITDAATHNIIKLGIFTPGEKRDLKESVAKHLNDLTNQIQETHPEAFRQLESITVTQEQKDAHLKAISNMADTRAQQFGIEVGKTVYEARNGGRAEIKRSLLEKFGPRAPELRALRDELIPPALRREAQYGGQSAVVFDPEGMDLIQGADSDEGQTKSRRLAFDSVTMAAVVTDMFDVFLKQVNVILKSYGVAAVPTKSIDMVESLTSIAACLTKFASGGGGSPKTGDQFTVNMVRCGVKAFGHFVDAVHGLHTAVAAR